MKPIVPQILDNNPQILDNNYNKQRFKTYRQINRQIDNLHR